MFCTHCGTKNDEDANFCIECGRSLDEKKGFHIPGFNFRRKQIFVAIAAVVLVVFVGNMLLGGRGYKKTIDMYMTASFEADAKTMFSLIPSKMLDYGLEESGYDSSDKRRLIKKIDDEMQSDIERVERSAGKKWKDIKKSYNIVSVEKIKGYELDDIKDDYKDVGVKVSAAKFVEVEITVQMGETEATNSMDIQVIKVGKSWYMDIGSMSDLF